MLVQRWCFARILNCNEKLPGGSPDATVVYEEKIAKIGEVSLQYSNHDRRVAKVNAENS